MPEILLMLPHLERITISPMGRWCPDVSSKERLNLPTVKEIRLVGQRTAFPFWLLDKCENLMDLSLEGTFEEPDDQAHDDSTPARLKSLLLCTSLKSSSLNWFKPRVSQLESLTLGVSSLVDPTVVSMLLGVCRATLKKLDIDLRNSACKV